jgi:TonB family protein
MYPQNNKEARDMTGANFYRMIGVLCLLFLAEGTAASQGAAGTITIPGLQEGNLNSSAPFGLGSPYFGSAQARFLTGRYQQVYAAAGFNGVQNITGIAFRADEGNGAAAGSSQLNNIFITLSVTSKPVGGLDAVFANNLTSPPATVYSGPLRFLWSASSGPARPFDFRIPFQQPFRYDPSLGNLLLDVTVIVGNAGTSTFALDAVSNNGMTSQVSLESTSPTGWREASGASRNIGLVTQFQTGVLSQQLTLAPAGPAVSLSARVSPPTVLSRVNPEYSDEARAARLQGTVVLEVVVHKDGTVDVVRVVRSLGLGLDEQAVKAVKQWRFKPGTRDGQPVDVYLNMEVNFNLQ